MSKQYVIMFDHKGALQVARTGSPEIVRRMNHPPAAISNKTMRVERSSWNRHGDRFVYLLEPLANYSIIEIKEMPYRKCKHIPTISQWCRNTGRYYCYLIWNIVFNRW